jgi:hypothetical protein
MIVGRPSSSGTEARHGREDPPRIADLLVGPFEGRTAARLRRDGRRPDHGLEPRGWRLRRPLQRPQPPGSRACFLTGWRSPGRCQSVGRPVRLESWRRRAPRREGGRLGSSDAHPGLPSFVRRAPPGHALRIDLRRKAGADSGAKRHRDRRYLPGCSRLEVSDEPSCSGARARPLPTHEDGRPGARVVWGFASAGPFGRWLGRRVDAL